MFGQIYGLYDRVAEIWISLRMIPNDVAARRDFREAMTDPQLKSRRGDLVLYALGAWQGGASFEFYSSPTEVLRGEQIDDVSPDPRQLGVMA